MTRNLVYVWYESTNEFLLMDLEEDFMSLARPNHFRRYIYVLMVETLEPA